MSFLVLLGCLPSSEQALLCRSGVARAQGRAVVTQKSPQISHSQLPPDRFLRRARWTYAKQNGVGKRWVKTGGCIHLD